MGKQLGKLLHLPTRCPICDGLMRAEATVEDPFAGQVCEECARGSRLLRVLKGEEEP